MGGRTCVAAPRRSADLGQDGAALQSLRGSTDGAVRGSDRRADHAASGAGGESAVIGITTNAYNSSYCASTIALTGSKPTVGVTTLNEVLPHPKVDRFESYGNS